MLCHEEKTDTIIENDDVDDAYDEYDTEQYNDDAETSEILNTFDLITQQLEEIRNNNFNYSFNISDKSSYYEVNMTIHIHDIIETSNITEEYFTAWHVNPNYPIIITLHILSSYFTDDVKPEIITITQQTPEGREYVCGLKHYLKHSTHSFIINYFREHNLFESFDNNIINVNKSLTVRKFINMLNLRSTYDIVENINRMIDENVIESDIINNLMEQKSHESSKTDQINVDIYIDNIFKAIVDFVRCKLTTCYHHCAICDNMIENPGIKMVSCSRDICKVGFIDVGAGFNIENIIMHEGQLLDLLLCLLFAYTSNGRTTTDLPHNVSINGFDEDINQTIILDSFTANDVFDKLKLRNIIGTIPSIEDMQNIITSSSNDTNIINVLNSIHPLIYQTIKWLYLSNMSYIRFLNESEQDSSVGTQWQFQTIFDNVEKEHRFNQLRQETILNKRTYKSKGKTGSFNAFHGTATYNGLPIIFHGLKNFSGTSMMSTGSALGSGIYTAEIISTAMNYARQCPTWCNSMFGDNMTLIFLCEIIDRPSDFTNTTNGYFNGSNVFVIPNEDYVITRRIIINPTNRTATTAQMRVTGILEATPIGEETKTR
jgi:hypothetical protein